MDGFRLKERRKHNKNTTEAHVGERGLKRQKQRRINPEALRARRIGAIYHVNKQNGRAFIGWNIWKARL
jgi:hypothetical protein